MSGNLTINLALNGNESVILNRWYSACRPMCPICFTDRIILSLKHIGFGRQVVNLDLQQGLLLDAGLPRGSSRRARATSRVRRFR